MKVEVKAQIRAAMQPVLMIDRDAFIEKLHPECGAVWWAGKQWAVTDFGLEVYADPDMYYIEKERLAENDWVAHMEGKTWVDHGEFHTAYIVACALHGIDVPFAQLMGQTYSKMYRES